MAAPAERMPVAGRPVPDGDRARQDGYWWRLPATGLCFLVFGLGGLIVGMLVLPLVRLTAFNRASRQARSRACVSACLAFFAGFMRALGVLSFSFEGRERLGRPGQLVIANHPTLIDVVFLVGLLPQANCVVKAALFAHPVTRSALRSTGYITNSTADEMIHAAEHALATGECLIMFPEGTRTKPDAPPQLHRGAANIALRGASIVTPVFIRCIPPTLSKNQPWYRIPLRRPHWVIRVGADIDPAPYRSASLPIGSRRLNDDLTSLFRDLGPMRNSHS